MVRSNHFPRRGSPRRGAILLVVLALLALFAVIGLSFVLYAESEANAARVAREAKRLPEEGLPPDPLPAAESILRQVLYGDPTNDRSALHGHDLARLKYGGQGGTAAYNGVGPVGGTLTGFPPTSLIPSMERAEVIHYARFGSGTNSEYIIDPEHVAPGFAVRADIGPRPNALYDASNNRVEPENSGGIYVPKNAGYTYPERNNAMLAVVTPPSPQVTNEQQIVAVSGYRRELFGSLSSPPTTLNPTGLLDVTDPTPNPEWLSPAGRHKILRPRPADHIFGGTSEFPYPPRNADGTITGDVQNYRFQNGPQRNDSLWMYPGLPVTQYKGRNITPLFAPMLLPLDGRLNLNAAGNLHASGSHGSHSGFGPHELALWRVLQNTTTAQQVITERQRQTTAPAPAELPDPGQAAFLASAPPAGQRYPNFPSPPFAPGVKPFHPSQTQPFRIDPAGPGETVLGVNQVLPPAGSQVNYRGALSSYQLPGGAVPMVPTPGAYFTSIPDYSNWATGLTASNSSFFAADPSDPSRLVPQGDTVGHPLLWNPLRRTSLQRGVTPFTLTPPAPPVPPGVFPISDMRLTAARYSTRQTDLQSQTFLAESDQTFDPTRSRSFAAEFARTGPGVAGNVNRALTTPISNSQQVVALGPNFFSDAGRTLTLPAPASPGTLAFPQLTAVPTLDVASSATVTQGNDNFDGSAVAPQVANRLARLGPVDLNRPLADYPVEPTGPLAGKLTRTAMLADPAGVLRADNDRQQFARDIFTRMALVTGAAVTFDGNQISLAPSATPGSPQYDALRWLAQYAANIVDAIDGDDISFAFVWNPTDPNDPRNAANFADAATISQRVVFGVEKPRLVINEAYAELTNDEADAGANAANGKFQARFFVELLNPGSTDRGAGVVTPRSVPLAYNGGADAVYQIQVFDNSGTVRTQLQNVTNVTGDVGAALTPRIDMPTRQLVTAQQAVDSDGQFVTADGPPDSAHAVEPNDGVYRSDPATQRRFGFALIGPGAAGGPATRLADDSTVFRPPVDDTANRFSMMIQKPLVPPPGPADPNTPVTDNMAYFFEPETDAQITAPMGPTDRVKSALDSRHSVVLRRLANPYLPQSPSNPFVTVDVMHDLRLFDAVRVAKGTVANPMDGNRSAPASEPKTRGSIGRAQPYAGFMPPFDPANPATNYTNSPSAAPDPYFVDPGTATRRTAYTTPPARANMTLRQRMTEADNDVDPTVYPVPTDAPEGIHHSFMTHNGDATFNADSPVPNGSVPGVTDAQADRNLQYPFSWMPHFDRPLINQEELLHVAACRPHELSTVFAQPGFYDPTTPAPNPPERPAVANLHTPSFPLAVRPAGSPEESTTLGRILEVLTVKPWVHDVPIGGRTAGKVNINMVWDKKVFDALFDANAGSSFTQADIDALWANFTQARTPSYPALGATDRPFKAFGTPTFAAGGSLPAASGIDDTLLRALSAGGPLLFENPNASNPYVRQEPLRKIVNNVTTTTDTFLLIYTVSYFEVRNTGPHYPTPGGAPVVLGKEVFDEVPGDLRAQFVAVLDRSTLGLPSGVTDPPRQYWETAISTDQPTPIQLPDFPSDVPSSLVQVLVNLRPANPIATPAFVAPGSSEYFFDTPLAVGTYNATDDNQGQQFALVGGDGMTQPGTLCGIGDGRERLVVRAFADATHQWSYDPLSGRSRIWLQVQGAPDGPYDLLNPTDASTAGVRTYPVGTKLSSHISGYVPQRNPPVPSARVPEFDPKRPSPQVPLFGRLSPQ